MKGVDAEYARKVNKGHDVPCVVKKGKKGNSLFAKKDIKRGSVIANYKFKVFRWDKFKGYKNNMYTMTVYTKKCRDSNTFIGDVYSGSIDEPRKGIPFIAHFSNEPSGRQKENCYLDVNLKENYKNRSRVKEGDTMIYRLRALKNIKKGEEICWCYSDSYDRYYKANCD
jgi:hypothetical protein